MQFDLDYVGHSATLSLPSDDTHMHNTAVLPSRIHIQNRILLCSMVLSQVFPLLQLLQLSLTKKRHRCAQRLPIWSDNQTRSALSRFLSLNKKTSHCPLASYLQVPSWSYLLKDCFCRREGPKYSPLFKTVISIKNGIMITDCFLPRWNSFWLQQLWAHLHAFAHQQKTCIIFSIYQARRAPIYILKLADK